jgi:mono/diheme cytochrome c family protein
MNLLTDITASDMADSMPIGVDTNDSAKTWGKERRQTKCIPSLMNPWIERFGVDMKYVIGGLASLALLIVAAAVFAFFGGYNVAATDTHNGLTQWFLATAMRRSVTTRATSVNAPAQFSSEQIADGFSEYDEMCVTCHGAPGRDRGEAGKGLNPRPPDLAKTAQDWSTGELFWIVKHGVKMTGMPAFGPTHSDERLWTIVGFLKQLPQLSPEKYAEMKHVSEKQHVDGHDEHTHPQ